MKLKWQVGVGWGTKKHIREYYDYLDSREAINKAKPVA